MSTPKSQSPALQGAGARRTRYAIQTMVMAVAITACCAFALVIADRYPARFDVTATREHQLSDRTLRLLGALKAPHEIIIAVNGAGVDARAARRTQDVLDSMQRASGNLRITMLDVALPSGAAQLDAALNRLADRYGSDIDRLKRSLESTQSSTKDLQDQLARLDASLSAAGKGIGGTDANADVLRKFFSDSAAFCRLSATDLADASVRATTLGASTIGRSQIPACDEALRALRLPLATVAGQITGISDGLLQLAASTAATVPEELRTSSKRMGAETSAARDRTARAIASIDDAPRLPIASVARLLERRSAAIVIGPPPQERSARGGVTGIDVSSLFPLRPAQDSAAPPPDTRARTEELITSALNAIANPDLPIVVLVHGESIRIAPEFAPYMTQWAERLRSQGLDVLEWPAAIDADPPSTLSLNPSGKRPVVFATVCTAASTRDGASRMLKLAAAVRRLVESGKPVLLSVNVSELPTTGQPDPMVEFLKPLGLEADTARPLLQQFTEPTGRIVSPDLVITDPKADHAVSGSIRGLALRLLWPVPIRSMPGATTAFQPIVTIDNANHSIWAESEWMAFRRVPPDQRNTIANPPAPDSPRDDAQGPWTIAAAVERLLTTPGAPATKQRLVVVGSNGWFFDEIAQAQTTLYGRPTLFSPANSELFDASITWLTGRDDAIAVSSQAQAQSLIPNLTDGTMSAIRWGLIGGLPILILFIGALWRLFRG